MICLVTGLSRLDTMIRATPLALVLAAACAPVPEGPGMRADIAPEFRTLAGWAEDDHAAALPALAQSCTWFVRQPPDRPLGRNGVVGTVADWQRACAAAEAVLPADHAAARRFLEQWFVPVAVPNDNGGVGLFTGYYAPELRGSWRRTGVYTVPLHRRPPPGRRLPTRAEIAAGALDGQELELLWVDDPVDAFFLEIQGSGNVVMEDGSRIGVGYHGWNGHPYFAIGRALIDRGEVTREEMSMTLIRDWLRRHPDQARDLMNLNRSYIFFRLRDSSDVVGSLEVPLTPGRSLAVDAGHIPLGTLLWLDIADDPTVPGGRLRRLVLAQDTGGAIRGAVAGDLFWGHGHEAGTLAGEMRASGRYYMLVPRTAAGHGAAGHGVAGHGVAGHGVAAGP